MASVRKPFSQLAIDVLEHADASLVKTANAAYTSEQMSTDLGKGLVKVAAQLRDAATQVEISYADLSEFWDRYVK